jgi:hypothetical protein
MDNSKMNGNFELEGRIIHEDISAFVDISEEKKICHKYNNIENRMVIIGYILGLITISTDLWPRILNFFGSFQSVFKNIFYICILLFMLYMLTIIFMHTFDKKDKGYWWPAHIEKWVYRFVFISISYLSSLFIVYVTIHMSPIVGYKYGYLIYVAIGFFIWIIYGVTAVYFILRQLGYLIKKRKFKPYNPFTFSDTVHELWPKQYYELYLNFMKLIELVCTILWPLLFVFGYSVIASNKAPMLLSLESIFLNLKANSFIIDVMNISLPIEYYIYCIMWFSFGIAYIFLTVIVFIKILSIAKFQRDKKIICNIDESYITYYEKYSNKNTSILSSIFKVLILLPIIAYIIVGLLQHYIFEPDMYSQLDSIFTKFLITSFILSVIPFIPEIKNPKIKSTLLFLYIAYLISAIIFMWFLTTLILTENIGAFWLYSPYLLGLSTLIVSLCLYMWNKLKTWKEKFTETYDDYADYLGLLEWN